MKIASIHQPHYHPWLGLLHKIAQSDLHIILDDVQFRRRNYHNRAQYCSAGSSKIMTLPVNNKGLQERHLRINDIQISSKKDLQKNFRTLQHNYANTPGWALIESELKKIYQTESHSLCELNLKLLQLMMECYQINTPIILSSRHPVTSTRNQRLIDLCINNGADTYLSGQGAKKYMDDELFNNQGIRVQYQTFTHPTYKQKNSTQFTPGCLALEWFCHSPEAASSWLQKHNPKDKVKTPSLSWLNRSPELAF